ncbi:unnamed protein product [Pipistrellus nathusii]|uniref:histone acetyltransferase n=1 Tax=Pipistrellus nathusii TaxID=59473 RepID=A0ABP0AL54_PIPNA
MVKLGLDEEADEGGSQHELQFRSLQEWWHQAIQCCIQSLRHAHQCHDTNCPQLSCQKMKKVVQHNKSCQCKTNGGCGVCKQFITLCCYHAKHYQETHAPFPTAFASTRSSTSRRYSTTGSTHSSCASGCYHQYPHHASTQSTLPSFSTTLALHTAFQNTLETTEPDCLCPCL